MEFNAEVFWNMFIWGSACGISFLAGQIVKQFELDANVVGIWKVIKLKATEKEKCFNKEFMKGAKFFATTYLMNSSGNHPKNKLEQDNEYHKVVSILDEDNMFDEYIKKSIRKKYENNKKL